MKLRILLNSSNYYPPYNTRIKRNENERLLRYEKKYIQNGMTKIFTAIILFVNSI